MRILQHITMQCQTFLALKSLTLHSDMLENTHRGNFIRGIPIVCNKSSCFVACNQYP